jgi:hypothetical protein
MRALTLGCLLLLACSAPVEGDETVAEANVAAASSAEPAPIDPTAPSLAKPLKGTLVATTNTGAMCAWTAEGVEEGSATTLTTPLVGGFYQVACERAADGKIISKNGSSSRARSS